MVLENILEPPVTAEGPNSFFGISLDEDTKVIYLEFEEPVVLFGMNLTSAKELKVALEELISKIEK